MDSKYVASIYNTHIFLFIFEILIIAATKHYAINQSICFFFICLCVSVKLKMKREKGMQKMQCMRCICWSDKRISEKNTEERKKNGDNCAAIVCALVNKTLQTQNPLSACFTSANKLRSKKHWAATHKKPP